MPYKLYVIIFVLNITKRRLHSSFPGGDWACGVKFYDSRELWKKEELGGDQEVVAHEVFAQVVGSRC